MEGPWTTKPAQWVWGLRPKLKRTKDTSNDCEDFVFFVEVHLLFTFRGEIWNLEWLTTDLMTLAKSPRINPGEHSEMPLPQIPPTLWIFDHNDNVEPLGFFQIQQSSLEWIVFEHLWTVTLIFVLACIYESSEISNEYTSKQLQYQQNSTVTSSRTTSSSWISLTVPGSSSKAFSDQWQQWLESMRLLRDDWVLKKWWLEDYTHPFWDIFEHDFHVYLFAWQDSSERLVSPPCPLVWGSSALVGKQTRTNQMCKWSIWYISKTL